MFSLFGKKPGKPKIIDRVFISVKAKNNALLELIRNNADAIVITWFDDSYERINALIKANNLTIEIFLAKQVAAHDTQNKTAIFYEHYPMAAKENELLEKLRLEEAIFYSSLDEPLFQYFGGDKIIGMLGRMGISENESIEHAMISKSIKNAQEKISSKIITEHYAPSQMDWFSKNLVK